GASACEQPAAAGAGAGSREPGAVRSAGRPAVFRVVQPADDAVWVDGGEIPGRAVQPGDDEVPGEAGRLVPAAVVGRVNPLQDRELGRVPDKPRLFCRAAAQAAGNERTSSRRPSCDTVRTRDPGGSASPSTQSSQPASMTLSPVPSAAPSAGRTHQARAAACPSPPD